jgi:hypothetical protein
MSLEWHLIAVGSRLWGKLAADEKLRIKKRDGTGVVPDSGGLMKTERKKRDGCCDHGSRLRAMKRRLSEIKHLKKFRKGKVDGTGVAPDSAGVVPGCVGDEIVSDKAIDEN